MFGMSDTTNTAEAGEQVEQSSEDQGFKAPQSQEELDRIVQKRLDRERAKFADYDEKAAAAGRLAEVEAESKARIDELTRELATAQGSAMKHEIAQAKGVPVDLLAGTSREELEAAADRVIQFRDEHARKGNYVPSEGRATSSDSNGDLREFTRRLFANTDPS